MKCWNLNLLTFISNDFIKNNSDILNEIKNRKFNITKDEDNNIIIED